MTYTPTDNVFFTADTHLNHTNILKYCGRAFDSIEEHNQELIKRWNDVVDHRDHVYHLGDVALGNPNEGRELIEQLNGDITLITGNHERVARENADLFHEILPYKEIRVDTNEKHLLSIVLFHYPIERWNKCHYGSLHLHGHVHSTLIQTADNRIDVGVDTWGYAPVSLQRILEVRDQPYENR